MNKKVHKDYYKILGVKPDVSTKGLKEAYRKLARRHHPDCSKEDDTQRFLEIQEAYETLRDPEKRRQYDQERQQQIQKPAYPPSKKTPFLRAEFQGYESIDDSPSLFKGLDDWLFGPGSGNDLHLDLYLDGEEAYYGGILPLRLPILEDCPRCRGTGRILGRGICSACLGYGTIARESEVRIQIPPQVGHLSVYRVSLGPLGYPGRSLYLHISIT